MAQTKTNSRTKKTQKQSEPKWNDCITGLMTIHANTFKRKGKKSITKFSTRLYRKMKDSDDYVNHYIDVAFIGEEIPSITEGKTKIRVTDAFLSLDYYVDKEGEIIHNPVIYVREFEEVEDEE